MKNDNMEPGKEQWIEGIFSSLEGAGKAKPPVEVWERIEARTIGQEQFRLPRWQRRVAVAAAVVLLAANVFALSYMQRSSSRASEAQSGAGATEQSLISGYNLYE